MELLQLQYFQTVARLEHMTKAAEELRVAQSALSKTISRLEKDLGVPLFDRQGRHIRLNSYGKAFLKKAEIALTALEEGRREVADLAGLERGSIYLVTSTLERLSEPLAAFRSLHPEVNFRITQASMDEMGPLLENSEVDFCLTAFPIKQPGVREVHVLGEEVLLGVPFGHHLAQRTSISLQEIVQEPFICYKEEHPLRKMNDELCQSAGITRHIVCEVDEPAAIGSLIKAGLGIAFVGCCVFQTAPAYAMIPIKHPECRRSLRIAWQEGRYLSQAAQRFKEFLVQYFADLANNKTPI